MSEKREIKCDQCDFDLTYTSNCEDYYLVLGNASKGHRGNSGVVTDVAIGRPVERTHHFCGVGCLAMWIQTHCPKAIEGYDRQQKHRAMLAERNARPVSG